MSISTSGLTLLVLGKVWPEPTSSAAGSRILQIMQLFKDQNYTITFGSAASKSPFSFDLASIGIMEVEIQLNNSSFDSFVKAMQPDVVLFDRFTTEEQFGWRVAENCSNALRLLDTEDLHCLREGRRIALKEDRVFNQFDLNNEIAKREIASILRCDLSIMISEKEIEILKDHFRISGDLLVYLPFIVSDSFGRSWKQYIDRKHFISIGNFLHEPNWDSIRFLKNEIWPKIRATNPKVELHIYGAYPSQKVQQLHNAKDGFLIKGRAVDALNTISNFRVLVAPLRFGAGLKGKLLDAMLTGTPSVTTQIGAEGMQGDFKWPGLIAEGTNAFAESCVKLYEQIDLWEKSQSKIKPLLEQRFAIELAISFTNRVNSVRKTLEKHRANNFLGQMLMHHHLASTRFMSKWIEEKNKDK